MQYALLKNHNSHIVLRITQTPKVTQFLEAQATGVVLAKLPTTTFNSEYDKAVPIPIPKAAASYLKIANRAFVHNNAVVSILNELINNTKGDNKCQ